MNDYESARDQYDVALARLLEDYYEAVVEFERLQTIHRQGDRSPEVGTEFRAKARQVHESVREFRAALRLLNDKRHSP